MSRFAVNLTKEVLSERDNVLPPFIKRRQAAAPTGDAVVEVEPERAAGFFLPPDFGWWRK